MRTLRPHQIAPLRTAILIAAALAAPLVAGAKPGFDAQVRATLTANYARFTQAFQKKDATAIGALLTDNYVATAADGTKTTKKQVLADLQGQMAMLHNVTWKRTITRLLVLGKNTLVTVDGDLIGTNTTKDGKNHQMELRATTEDTWLEVGKGIGNWKLAKSKVTRVKMLRDGKEAPGR